MFKIFFFVLMLNMTIFGSDTFTITYTLYKEAGGESHIGKLAVATVIYNRKTKTQSFSDVCLKKKQFSCWNNIKNVNRPTLKLSNNMDWNSWDECFKIAVSMTDGTFKPIGNWNQYYNPNKCSPSWENKMKNIKIIGNHKFGKL